MGRAVGCSLHSFIFFCLSPVGKEHGAAFLVVTRRLTPRGAAAPGHVETLKTEREQQSRWGQRKAGGARSLPARKAVDHQEKTVDQWDESLPPARGQGAHTQPRVSGDSVRPPQSLTPGVSQTSSECGRETSRGGSLHLQNSHAHRGHSQNRPSPSKLPAPRRQVLTPQFTGEPTSSKEPGKEGT